MDMEDSAEFLGAIQLLRHVKWDKRGFHTRTVQYHFYTER